VKYLKRILNIFPIVLCATVLQAHALEKSKDGFCHLSQEVLANPDLVIKDAMENSEQHESKNCFDIYLSDSIEFSERGGPVYPLKGSKIKKAGWGIYRDFKILGSKPGPELDGYQTIIYEVELIYIAMTRDGPTVPICEYSKVPMRMVNTPWGWRFKPKYGYGSNLKIEIKAWERILKERLSYFPNTDLTKNNEENIEINQLIKFSEKCKLKLN
jgi:hypothetical protein